MSQTASMSAHPQISNIRIIKEAMREASFLYAELLALGAAMTTVDVGGGLAVDYEVIHCIGSSLQPISAAPTYCNPPTAISRPL